MNLVELGQKNIQRSHELMLNARNGQLSPNPENPDDPEIRFFSLLEAAILKAIEQSADIAELKAFLDLNVELFDLPFQSQFNALERRLELGDHSADALNMYQFIIQFINASLEYKPLAEHILASLKQLDVENAPPAAYEQLRLETVERIHQLQQQGIYVLDPPELWAR